MSDITKALVWIFWLFIAFLFAFFFRIFFLFSIQFLLLEYSVEPRNHEANFLLIDKKERQKTKIKLKS